MRGGPAASPFDGVAADYDGTFTDRLPGRWLRAAVQERLGAAFEAGDRVLDLGCGTGEDAIWLARRGVAVTAVDQSPAMLRVAAAKAEAAGVAAGVDWVQFDLASPAGAPWGGAAYDGAYSDFGALNCLPDRPAVAEALGGWVRPGGRVVLVVMGPFCPWDVACHLALGHPRTATRRFRSGREARIGDAVVRVWYPSPRRLRSELRPWFRHLETVGIGVLLPPSYASHLVERWPRLFSGLRAADGRIGSRFPFSWLNDHYLSMFERR